MTEDQTKVWNVVRRRVGRENAICMADLALHALGSSGATRQAQKIISQLRNAPHFLPIGSSSCKPNGFYLASSLKELKCTTREMINRGANTIKTARAIEKNYAKYSEQLDFFE